MPYEKGWSPYKAKDFLLGEGLETGFYNKLCDEWFASSPMVKFGDALIPNNVAFYIEGTENVANTLKIKLNVNDSSSSDVAQRKLLELSSVLSKASINQELSDLMKNAIIDGKQHTEVHGNKKVTTSKVVWSGHKFNGYDSNFVVSSI